MKEFRRAKQLLIKIKEKLEKVATIKVISENLIVIFKVVKYALENIVLIKRLRSEDIELQTISIDIKKVLKKNLI